MRHPSACLFGRDDLTDRLAEITCPALVVHGVGDTALPMEDSHRLADGVPGAGPVVEVPGAHAANLTHPGPVNGALLGSSPTCGPEAALSGCRRDLRRGPGARIITCWADVRDCKVPSTIDDPVILEAIGQLVKALARDR